MESPQNRICKELIDLAILPPKAIELKAYILDRLCVGEDRGDNSWDSLLTI